MRTQAIGPTSSEQIMWWKVDLGGFYNVYRITIMFKNYEEYPSFGILALVIVSVKYHMNFMYFYGYEA